MNDLVFKEKIKSVMMDNKYDRFVGGKKKGVLDGSALWKVPIGGNNVFKRREERKGKHYNVEILVDLSGSMGYPGWGRSDKINICAETAVFITQILEMNDINVEIIGFNEEIITIKEFDEKIKPKSVYTELVYRVDYHENEKNIKITADEEMLIPEVYEIDFSDGKIGGNHDYDAIEKGYENLRKKKGESIMLVFSDGKPACDNPSKCGYDQDKHETSTIRKLIKANEDIKTIGIGVGDKHVQEIYDNNIVVDNKNLKDKFKKEIIQIFSKIIKRK